MGGDGDAGGGCEPVCGDNRVSLDINFFGFGLMPDFGNGGSVFLFLKLATHLQFCLFSIPVSGEGYSVFCWGFPRNFNLAYVRIDDRWLFDVRGSALAPSTSSF